MKQKEEKSENHPTNQSPRYARQYSGLTCVYLASYEENKESEGKMAENFAKLIKDIDLHIQKAQQIPNKLNMKRTTH